MHIEELAAALRENKIPEATISAEGHVSVTVPDDHSEFSHFTDTGYMPYKVGGVMRISGGSIFPGIRFESPELAVEFLKASPQQRDLILRERNRRLNIARLKEEIAKLQAELTSLEATGQPVDSKNVKKK